MRNLNNSHQRLWFLKSGKGACKRYSGCQKRYSVKPLGSPDPTLTDGVLDQRLSVDTSSSQRAQKCFTC